MKSRKTSLPIISSPSPNRLVVPGGAGGAMDFGRSVNPISTRGTDYAHLITTAHWEELL